MKGAEVYSDLSKDTWRGWKWNAISRAALQFNDRLSPAERSRRLGQMTVLYLVGPDDNDRTKALAKGFAAHNLIAVDLLQERVDEVRRDGGLAIRGSLQTILLNWPKDWPLDVIDGDFCSGLVNDIGELPFCLQLCRGAHADTVVSLNLMRGRDAHSNCERESAASYVDVLNRAFAACGCKTLELDLIKHRGVNWVVHLANCFAQVRDCAAGTAPVRDEKGRLGVLMAAGEVFDWIRNVWHPQVSSYRSKTSRQVFDSVVHRWGMQMFDQDGISKHVWEGNRKAVCDKLSKLAGDDDGIRERIAALRAVRTKKRAR